MYTIGPINYGSPEYYTQHVEPRRPSATGLNFRLLTSLLAVVMDASRDSDINSYHSLYK